MVFCSKCGTQSEDGTRICPKCGTPIVTADEASSVKDAADMINAIAQEEEETARKKARNEWIAVIASLALMIAFVFYIISGGIKYGEEFFEGVDFKEAIIVIPYFCSFPAGFLFTVRHMKSLRFINVFIPVGPMVYFIFIPAFGSFLLGGICFVCYLIKRIIALFRKKKTVSS